MVYNAIICDALTLNIHLYVLFGLKYSIPIANTIFFLKTNSTHEMKSQDRKNKFFFEELRNSLL